MRIVSRCVLLGLFCLTRPIGAQVEMQLLAGTPVPVVMVTELSSETAKKGTHFTLVVDSNVTIFHIALIAKGARALGTVITAKPAGRFGHPGQLAITIDSIQAVDSRFLKLRVGTGDDASQPITGTTGQPSTDLKSQVTSRATNVLTSAMPIAGDALGFLHKGGAMVYKAGTRFWMVTDADVVVHVPESAIPKPPAAGHDSTAKP